MDIHDVLIREAVTTAAIESDAVQSDAQQIAAIYNHYVDVGGATFDQVHWTTRRTTALISTPLPDGWYVAEYDGTVIGWASARQFSERHGYRFACETAIYLDAASVGRGAADRLQKKIDAHCRDNGIHHAMAKIIASNERSLAFHYRHGYELVGTQKEVGHLEGEWSDVTILQKIF